MAEAMEYEARRVARPDNILVPSKDSKSGWKYIDATEYKAKKARAQERVPGGKPVIRTAAAATLKTTQNQSKSFNFNTGELASISKMLHTGGAKRKPAAAMNIVD